MNDSYNLLVLGGTSSIALAYAKQRIELLVKDGLTPNILLLGRDESKLGAECANFTVLGANAEFKKVDLNQVNYNVFTKFDSPFDETLLAYGTLTDQSHAQSDEQYRTEQIQTNFVSATHWVEAILAEFEKAGGGKLIVLGSVAGDRGRQSNYIYGASKAALATLVQGAQHRFASTKEISITLIKPGFVDTPMTAHIENRGGVLWSTPDQIAASIIKGVNKRKRVVYAPFFWGLIMFAIRNIPSIIFEKTKL